jgi:hypothetical protein
MDDLEKFAFDVAESRRKLRWYLIRWDKLTPRQRQSRGGVPATVSTVRKPHDGGSAVNHFPVLPTVAEVCDDPEFIRWIHARLLGRW